MDAAVRTRDHPRLRPPADDDETKGTPRMRPRRALVPLALLALLLGFAGCQAGKPDSSSTSGAAASGSKYDAGPRAAEQPVNEELAETGEQLFRAKGCSACHAFGAKLSGPDLAGVTTRRTALWMEHQILEPEVMVKEDPIARALFAQYALQMTNQHLTPDEAKAVIEYLKHEDREAGKGD
jgi:mono/diheme cytochrome c family protein